MKLLKLAKTQVENLCSPTREQCLRVELYDTR